jgi:hypothetical protein
VQPHRGDKDASVTEKSFTTVLGLVSEDGGETWGRGTGLTVSVPGRPSVYMDSYDGHQGIVFIPCPNLGNGYFGHYNGGAFVNERGSTDKDSTK